VIADMEAVAKAKFLRGSARKMRLLADVVRGQNLVWATERLKFMPQAAAGRLRKILQAAAANAISVEGSAKLKAESLHITRLTVDGAPIARRFRAVGMGRAYRIRKRYCHVTVVVSDAQAGKTGTAKTDSSRKQTEPKTIREQREARRG
jgi:large subunit ribosomal protein L22